MTRRPVVAATTLTCVVAVAVTAGLVLAGPAGAAATALPEGVTVIDRETVQARLDSTGKVKTARVYEQLTVLGNGRVAIVDPTSGKGVRDLDGFDAPTVRDGKARYSVTVDGRTDRRTVADHEGDLPVTLTASYTLDGEPVEPSDVVGRTGRLEATYLVRNATATPTEISYTDGRGDTVTETVDLVTPYVGTLATVAPGAYSGIAADGAAVAGDGRGGTKLSWSLVLFDPLGEPAQQLTWSADVTDAELPPAELTVVPVAPGGNKVIDSGEQSIQEGATGLTTLTGGVLKVDGKLGELQAGAAKILDGLEKLAAGADELNAGLAGKAAPGADLLADGLARAEAGGGALSTGLGELATGAGTLSDGLGEARNGSGQLAAGLGSAAAGSEELAAGSVALADGAGAAAAGAATLAEGLAQISAGLDQLSGTTALPAARAGAVQLRTGVDALLAGLGDAATEGTILNGVAKLSGGLTTVDAGIGQVSAGLSGAQSKVAASRAELGTKLKAGGELDRLVGGAAAVAAAIDQLCTAAAPAVGTQSIAAALVAACTPKSAAEPGIKLGSAGVAAGTATVKSSTEASYASLGELESGLGAAVTGLGKLSGGVGQLQTGTTALNAGLGKIVLGLRSGDPARPGIAEGLDGLVAGLTTAVGGVSQLATGAKSAAGGSTALADGTGAVAAGAQRLSAEGTAPLADGLAQLLAGGMALDAGIGRLDDGGQLLATGAGTARDGSTTLADGLTRLLTGSRELAGGLDDAADGSALLADGIGQVQDGVTAVEEGARRLSGEGTQLIATSAHAAATQNAKKAAMLRAVAAKGSDGALPYGAPEGATGTAAYNLVLAGADTTARDNTTRGAAALALLALGSLSGWVVRRRVTA